MREYNRPKVVTCQQIESFVEGLVAVKQKGKWGFIDKNGDIAIPCRYDNTHCFSEGLAAVMQNGKWGFINRAGVEVIPCVYDDTLEFSEGLVGVKTGGKWAFIDKRGKQVIADTYVKVKSFSEGMCGVYDGAYWGFINNEGKLIIPHTYDSISIFKGGSVYVEFDGKIGFIDKEQKEIIPLKYDVYTGSSESPDLVCLKEEDETWTIFDRQGNITASGLKYDRLFVFSEGMCPVKSKDQKHGCINSKGELIVPLEYDFLLWFSDGLVGAYRESSNTLGFINAKNETIIPFEYTSIKFFSDGLAEVCKQKRKYFINTKNEIVFEVKIVRNRIKYIFSIIIIAGLIAYFIYLFNS